MGGYGSGRSGGRPVIEDALTLNLSRLFKTGWLKPGVATSGTLCWTIVETGEEIASVGFYARLDDARGHISLNWTSTDWTGAKRACSAQIELTTTLQPFGGRRWWFICPLTARRATRLSLPNGASAFACRSAYRMAYRSQRVASHERAVSRAFAIRRKLGNDGAIGDLVLKPKGMHWRTFERAMKRLNEVEDVVEDHTVLLLDRLNRPARRDAPRSRRR